MKRQALQDGESPEEEQQKKSRLHRLSFGLHKKEKSADVAEPTPHSPGTLKSFMNRLKGKSGSSDPKLTKDKRTADAIHTAEARPDGEAQPDMVDSRQISPDLPDDDSFEDATEHQGGDDDAQAPHEPSLFANFDGPARHRLSLSSHSDSTPRESKFHEQLDAARE
jgi:hypothetical protein